MDFLRRLIRVEGVIEGEARGIMTFQLQDQRFTIEATNIRLSNKKVVYKKVVLAAQKVKKVQYWTTEI